MYDDDLYNEFIESSCYLLGNLTTSGIVFLLPFLQYINVDMDCCFSRELHVGGEVLDPRHYDTAVSQH